MNTRFPSLRPCVFLALLCLVTGCFADPSRSADFLIENGSDTDSLIVVFSMGDEKETEVDAVRLTKNRSFKIWGKVFHDSASYEEELFDAFRNYLGNKRNLSVSVFRPGSDSVLCRWSHDSTIPTERIFYDPAGWNATISSKNRTFGSLFLGSHIHWLFTFTITDDMLKQNNIE